MGMEVRVVEMGRASSFVIIVSRPIPVVTEMMTFIGASSVSMTLVISKPIPVILVVAMVTFATTSSVSVVILSQASLYFPNFHVHPRKVASQAGPSDSTISHHELTSNPSP
jgi:hypothetical protein